jgi:hypothetical protein
MVFVGGYLLPHGSFRLEPSPIDPTLCDVSIVGNHARLPAPLRAAFDALEPAPPGKGPPPALADLRCFALVPSGGSAVLIELTPRGIKVVRA